MIVLLLILIFLALLFPGGMRLLLTLLLVGFLFSLAGIVGEDDHSPGHDFVHGVQHHEQGRK